MTPRLDYASIAPDGYRALGQVHQYVVECGLERELIDLVYLRISQINGCGYCVDMHFRDAVSAGVDPRKINSVITWEEAPFFSDRERAALAWAEELTNVRETQASDAAYASAADHFEKKELVDLTYAIAIMNAFNRLGVGFRQSADP